MYGPRTRLVRGIYFGGVFNKTMIPFHLLDMRLVIANEALRARAGYLPSSETQGLQDPEATSRDDAIFLGVNFRPKTSHRPGE